MFNKRTVRAFSAIGISIAIAIAGFGTTCIWKYYDLANSCSDTFTTPVITMESTYVAKDAYKLQEIHPCKGKVYCSLLQYSGTKGGKYKVEYKKKGAKNYTSIGTFTCKTNNTWSKNTLLINAPNSATTYVVKITKMNNTNKQSKIKFKYTK